MKTITARAPFDVELAVLRNTLLRSGVGRISTIALEEIANLTVVGECGCGCRSVYFQTCSSGDHLVADGIGYLRSGESVGVLVWASDAGKIVLLEMVDHAGAGELPLPESVCSWEEAGIREIKK